MTTKDWIFLAVAIIAIIVAVIGWLRPRAPRPAPTIPPDLSLVRVGGVGSSSGPSSYVKAGLQIRNREGAGTAHGWEVSVAEVPGVKVGQLQRRGPVDFASTVRWSGDSLPPGQSRDLDGWLWVAASTANAGQVILASTIRAEAMSPKTGTVVVKFPSSTQEADVGLEWP
jgi:hypothetical protein